MPGFRFGGANAERDCPFALWVPPVTRKLTRRALDRLESDAARAVAFLETLRIPEGPRAGERLS